VRRADDPVDRRVYRVKLTPAGRTLWEKISPAYEAVVMQVVASLTAAQAETTLATLMQLQAGAVVWQLPDDALKPAQTLNP
jgi:DNA-binding MarR family transcriptional regulator